MQGRKDLSDRFRFGCIEIRATGNVIVYPMEKRDIPISYLYRAVGGHVEIVNLRFRNAKNNRSRYLMVVNDEGRLLGKRPNPIASLLYGDLIVGDVVIGIQETDPEPDIYAIPIEEARELAQYIKEHYATLKSYD